MGGQNSKLTPEGEAVPPRIRSLLQRRFEEIKIRGKARKLKASSSNLSKKELLSDGEHEGEQEEVDISLPHSLRSSPEFDNVPSPEEPPTLQNKSKDATTLTDSEDKGTKQANEDQHKRDGTACKAEDGHKEPKGVKVYIGGVFAMEETTEGEEEDEDNEDDSHRDRELLMCPASPSFRVYCKEPVESENDDSKNYSTDDFHSDDEEIKHKKSSSAESADSNSDSVPSTTDHNNGQETKTKKKGRRRRRIRKAFSMGGPSAVKNLLNVKGCYYAVGCSGGHDRAAYLAEKSAAT